MTRLVAIAILLVSSLGLTLVRPDGASAQDAGPTPTVITLDLPATARSGDTFAVVVHLADDTGAPIADASVAVLAAGAVVGRGHTDAGGAASIVIGQGIEADRVTLVASFDGSTSRQLAAATSDPATLQLLPLAPPGLTFDPVGATAVGDHPELVLHARDDADAPIADIAVAVSLNGVPVGTLHTGDDGTGSLIVRSDLAAGRYVISGSYSGSVRRKLAPVTVVGALDVSVGTVRISTVPPIPGAEFALVPAEEASHALDDPAYRFAADGHGNASVALNHAGGYVLRVLPQQETDTDTTRRAFSRWTSDSFDADRLLNISSSAQFTAGFDVSYRVSHTFVDKSDAAIDAARVDSVVLTNSLGDKVTLPVQGPVWLQASRVVRRFDSLESVPVLYSIQSVAIHGTNVVNKYEQRFYAGPDKSVPIVLSMYSMKISTRDAIFGFGVGSSVQLVYPDGHQETQDLGGDHSWTVLSLPRGEYRVHIRGGGLSSTPGVVLSRDQEVQIRVISYLDFALVGIVGLAVAIGLFLAGRWHFMRTRADARLRELAGLSANLEAPR